MDMSVDERLLKDDVQTLGYFPAERGVLVLAFIADQPHLGTVDTVPLTLEPLSGTRFITTATQLLADAEDYAAPDLFP